MQFYNHSSQPPCGQGFFIKTYYIFKTIIYPNLPEVQFENLYLHPFKKPNQYYFEEFTSHTFSVSKKILQWR